MRYTDVWYEYLQKQRGIRRKTKQRVCRREWEKFRPSFTRLALVPSCCFLHSNFVKNIFFKTELVVAAARYRILGSHIGLSNLKQNSLVDCFLGRLLWDIQFVAEADSSSGAKAGVRFLKCLKRKPRGSMASLLLRSLLSHGFYH